MLTDRQNNQLSDMVYRLDSSREDHLEILQSGASIWIPNKGKKLKDIK